MSSSPTPRYWFPRGRADPAFRINPQIAVTLVERVVVALASDPHILARSGQAVGTGPLAREYGFTDRDGSQPFFGAYFSALAQHEARVNEYDTNAS